MPQIGWLEILIIVSIAIIVVGPKELPNLLRQLGAFSKSLKKASRQFKNSLNELSEEGDLKDIKKSFSDFKDIKNNLDPTKNIKEELSSIKETAIFTDKEISNINNKIKKD